MAKSGIDAKTCTRLFVATLLAVGVNFWLFPCSALAEQEYEELSPVENWVLEQVKAGKVADIEERFPDEKDRVLSAGFIEELLTSEPEDALVHRHGVRIEHAIFTEPLDLVNAEVPYNVWLEHCQFDSRVNLSMSHFARVLSFRYSRFREANFFSIEVGYAVFENAVFEGATDFHYARIGGNFEANGAQFTNPEKEAYFHRMTVGDTAFFEKAIFEGLVDFSYAQIDGNFQANEARFNNVKTEADFDSMTVGGVAKFEGAVFEGPVDFRYAQIGSNFEANESRFNNAETEADFDSMTVEGKAFFQEAIFAGLADFGHAQVGSNFVAYRANFNNAGKAANFVRMTVGGKAFLQEAIFAGGVDFRYAEFLWLDIQATSWPAESESVSLSEMTYKHIYAGPEEDDAWRELLRWVDGSAYSAQPYAQLEAFFRAEGYPERADAVFVARKRRERKEALEGLSAWWNVFLECFVLYGRSPERAFGWSGLVILFGWWLFRRREDMEPRKQEDASQSYSPFWYSLDLFLPINLQMANMWRPTRNHRFAWYVRVHTILGWILIPIGLAAVMGIIK